MSSITAILVTYNSAGVISRALEAIVRAPEIGEIIVVDNASSDETCALITRDFPAVTLIKNRTNEGFGQGNNIALVHVKTPYALLVNPDAVMKDGAVKELLFAAQNYPDAAILAPMLYDAEGRLDASYKRNIFARERKSGTFYEPEGDMCAEFLSGAVWLLNMALIKPLGFFDPAIFLYYEDDDLCLRARAAGYGLVLVHAAHAMHLKGGSSGAPNPGSEFFKQQHLIWSRLYLEQKYQGNVSADKLALKLAWEYGTKTVLYTLVLNRPKANRYRGRLAGVEKFLEKTTPG